MKCLYFLGDGNNVQRRVDYYLLSENLESLQAFSTSLKISIQKIASMAAEKMSADIIFVGGDELLFKVLDSSFDEALIKSMSEIFFHETGLSISFGIGPTIRSAYINLRHAKACASIFKFSDN